MQAHLDSLKPEFEKDGLLFTHQWAADKTSSSTGGSRAMKVARGIGSLSMKGINYLFSEDKPEDIEKE